MARMSDTKPVYHPKERLPAIVEDPKPARGRPTDYRSEMVEYTRRLCLLGATIKDIADFWGVLPGAINVWREKHPEFDQAIREGGMAADARVAEALFHKAIGYSHKVIKTFVIDGQIVDHEVEERLPPETTAAVKWLHNRQRELWRANTTVEVTGKDGAPLEMSDVTPFELARRVMMMLDAGLANAERGNADGVKH